jgi:S1-C subfamily serine protease
MVNRYNYRYYACTVAYVEIAGGDGAPHLGSAFHVGSGIFVTAKHVVDQGKVKALATTKPHRTPVVVDPSRDLDEWASTGPFSGEPKGPFLSDPGSDVALLVLDSARELPALRLSKELSEQDADEMVLRSATIMGYPRVPLTKDPPVLVALSAEINAATGTYKDGNRYFIASSMARGGFSGGPVVLEDFNPVVIGLVTESFCVDDHPPELGFMAVLSVDAIILCLKKYAMIPDAQRVADTWRGAWRPD